MVHIFKFIDIHACYFKTVHYGERYNFVLRNLNLSPLIKTKEFQTITP